MKLHNIVRHALQAGTVLLLLLVALVIFSKNALAAHNVYVTCTINGTDAPGESTVVSMDREGTIEVHGLGQGINSAIDLSGRTTGKMQYTPIRIMKKVDSSTPHFINAMLNQQPTDCIMRFFRPDASGSGAEEQFYTVSITNGRVLSISQHLPNRLAQETMTLPLSEIIAIQFESITWTYEIGGTSFQTNLGRQ